VLTSPWTINGIYKREDNPVWDFVDCAENNPGIATRAPVSSERVRKDGQAVG